MHYVEVAVAKQRGGKRFYTYHSEFFVEPGTLIKVPFLRSTVLAIVITVVKKPEFITKPVIEILPVIVPKQSLLLLNWLTKFYPDDYGVLSQLLVPKNLPKKQPFTVAKPVVGTSIDLPKANPEQQAALLDINANARVLLHGDTGTGKTRVFLESAKQMLAQKKSVIIVTPEIGLTPQLVADITTHLPAPIILTHSALTEAERRKAWLYAYSSSTPTVYVGPRSTLFLPYKNIGLIVIDEAHDAAYKQGQSPRYQALHVAAEIATIHKAKLVYSTATPNVSDYQQAIERGVHISRLTTFAAGKHKSSIEIVDITDRSGFTKDSFISDKLTSALQATFKSGEQSILFLNRRGSARLVQCSDCGWQAICPRCGIPLTYHHDTYTFRCHSCSHSVKAFTKCPTCGSIELQFKSIGTKTLVESIKKILPKAKIMRFDTDNNPDEQLHKHIHTIKKGDVDIVIGTQIISKGIDLPNLGLVGVLNADTGLNLPDYRAEEQTFQQLYQVVGRVDRGHRAGRAIIQTRVPEHPVMQAVLHRSWDSFLAYELHKRHVFGYPPYSFIALFSISKKSSTQAEIAAKKAFEILKTANLGIQLLGPSPSFFEMRNSMYAWHIIAKSSKRSLLLQASSLLAADWKTDLDPISLL